MKVTGIVAKAAMYVIMVLSVILVASSALDVNPMADGSYTGVVISWTIGVLVLGIVGAIVSALAGVIGDSKALVKTLIGVAVAAIIVFVAWSLSDSTPLLIPGYEGTDNAYPWLNIADTGIFIFYLAAGAAVLTIVASEVYNMFK